MIRVSKCLNLEDYGLLLQDGCLTITKNVDEAIYIDRSLRVKILDGLNIKIVDQVLDGDVLVYIDNDSYLDYQILNTNNCNHKFLCYGHVKVMQITLGATSEDFNIELLKEGATAYVDVLSLGSNVKEVFNQSIVHNAMHTESNISNFGIAMVGSEIVFDTTGKINKKMAKSICRQLSKGVVMDDDSAVTSKPILLIDEYDVVANHGASIGKMSDESLFYLMSRGLTKTEAFLLILEGILRPFIDKIMDEELKGSLEKEIRALI